MMLHGDVTFADSDPHKYVSQLQNNEECSWMPKSTGLSQSPGN